MPVYKVTYVFSSQGYGWTESYYLNLAQPTDLQSIFLSYATNLGNLRLNILGTTASLDYCRISNPSVKFATYLRTIQQAGKFGVAAAFPNVALLLRMAPTVAGPQKSLFLRGLPHTIISSGMYAPTDIWNQSFNAYRNFLTASQPGQWGWNGVVTSNRSIVTGYTFTTQPPNAYQVTVVAKDNVFAFQTPGQLYQVRFSGINGKSELNGTQVVINIDPKTVITKQQFGVLPYQFGGQVESFQKAFAQILRVQAERIMTRKAGRQLFLEHGRARVRVRT